jgi:hypothetical protein
VKANLATALTAASVAVLLTAVGCGSKSTTETSSSSSPAQASSSKAASPTSKTPAATEQDYSRLLIAAEDIVAPGDTFTAKAPMVNPNGQPGVATVFSNDGDTHEIGDTILVLPDPDAAGVALQGAQGALSQSVTGGEPQPAQIGSDSVMIAGTSPDGSKAVTVLLFVEGRAFTTLEFDSAADDPVPTEFVLDVATKQDAKIKAGLSG